MNRRIWMVGCLAMGLAGSGSAPAAIYVATNGTHDAANRFDTWAGAATNIHEAMAIATNGDTVLVSNGVYRLTNEIALASGIVLRSVSGPSNTVLLAQGESGGFRLVNLTHAGAVLAGFTLTNGYHATEGAGARMTAGTVSNCLITGCGKSAVGRGGGVYMTGGRLIGVTIEACIANYAGGFEMTGGSNEAGVVRNNTSVYNGSIMNGGVARRCRIYGNAASYWGGGVALSGTARLENSLIFSNRITVASHTRSNVGGGVYMTGGTLENCTIAFNLSGTLQNAMPSGGGVYVYSGTPTIRNCIICRNTRLPGLDDNYAGPAMPGTTIQYSCAPELTNSTVGNIVADPRFVSTVGPDLRLQVGSPCIDAGTNTVTVTNDIELTARPLAGNSLGVAFPDMGAYEANGNGGILQVGIGASPAEGLDSVACKLTALAVGTNTDIVWYGWDFTNGGTFVMSGAGLGVVTNTYGPGIFSVRLRITNSAGESASVVCANLVKVSAATLYVSENGLSRFPYSTWENAATNIHDAVNAAASGAAIMVSNGAYRLTNQIALTIPLTLRGVNGAEVTSLYRDAGSDYFRLLYLNHPGVDVQGFSLSNGVSTSIGGGIFMQAGLVRDCAITNCEVSHAIYSGTGGGGLRLEGGLVSNTVIAGCRSVDTIGVDTAHRGGGVWMIAGKLAQCTIRHCTTKFGAVHATGGSLEDCTIRNNSSTYYQGGAFIDKATLRRCRIFNNTGAHDGGGVIVKTGALMENCLVYSNRASTRYGGGIYVEGGTVQNCTIAGNDVATASLGGGVYQVGGTILNAIVFGNTRGTLDDNYRVTGGSIAYSCAPELAPGVNSNIAANPQFENASLFDYRLQFGSPCIDVGTNLTTFSNDIDLAFRPLDGDGAGGAAWDMGAYEAPDASLGPFGVTFSATPRSGLTSIDAVFTATPAGSDTNIVWYGWDFDGNGSFERTGPGLGIVTQTFTAGRYTVSLLASNGSSQAASATNADYIMVSSPDIYVVTNGTPSFPYGSWGAAATSIHDAVGAAIAGSTIHLTNGTHRAQYQIALADAIVLRGESGAGDTILARDPAAGNFGVVLLSHSNALIEGVTIAQGSATTMGGGVYMLAGTVRDCVITNCEAAGTGTGGGGIRLENGLVADTLIVNCRATGMSRQGGGIWMTGGRCERSTIRACVGYIAGGIYAGGGGGCGGLRDTGLYDGLYLRIGCRQRTVQALPVYREHGGLLGRGHED